MRSRRVPLLLVSSLAALWTAPWAGAATVSVVPGPGFGSATFDAAGGSRRSVATAHFPMRRWKGQSARLRLTSHGQRLASRGRRTRLAVTLTGENLPPMRWSVRLRLPTRR